MYDEVISLVILAEERWYAHLQVCCQSGSHTSVKKACVHLIDSPEEQQSRAQGRCEFAGMLVQRHKPEI